MGCKESNLTNKQGVVLKHFPVDFTTQFGGVKLPKFVKIAFFY